MDDIIQWALFFMTLVVGVGTVSIKGSHAGVNTVTGERPFRQEFSIFQNSGPAFDLYIQSLYYFMQEDQSELLSYYQVAGIHGVPFHSWDDVEGTQLNRGYCTHGSILFPSWHRPYLALFEQILWDYANRLASAYPPPQREKYQEAARSFRIPYWDWAASPSMPDLTNTPTVLINLPSGICNCPNPLSGYSFHPLPSSADFSPDDPLSTFNRTVRSPDANGESQPELSNQQLVANGASLHTQTYQLIATQPDYAPFSNTAYSDDRGGQYNSLENMHNAVHTFVGGDGGHMSDIPYSAFDPIFWLHHANVDRLFAIWQAIYPDSYTTSQVNEVGTYTDAPGSTEDINTHLTPFHSDDSGTLYTSETARSTLAFGYTYPEVVDWGVDSTQLSSNVRTKLNQLYNPTSSVSKRSFKEKRRGNAALLSPNGADHQWFVNIRVDKSAIQSSFFVHFFLGTVPESSNTWCFAPTLIASHPVLAPSVPLSPTVNPLSYGQISLTHSLLSSAQVDLNLSPDRVIPILTEQLRWRVQTFKGEPVDTALVQSLKLYVAGRTAEQPQGTSEDEFPSYGPIIAYREVTRGQPGGLGDEEPM